MRQLFATEEILFALFAYIRWLDDRHGIEKMITSWNETVVDRRLDLERWLPPIRKFVERQFPVHGYVNNHYAGYAPGTLALLQDLLERE